MATRTAPRNGRICFALLGAVLIAFFALGGPAAAGIGDGPALPSISSDKADYAPGESVTLSGANWASGESVHVVVNDDAGQTWRYEADATAADDGSFSLQFNLPDWFVATYSVTATGASSGTATTSFSDGNADLTNAASTQATVGATFKLENLGSSLCTATGTFPSRTATLVGPGGGFDPKLGANLNDRVRITASAVTTGWEIEKYTWVDSQGSGSTTLTPNAAGVVCGPVLLANNSQVLITAFYKVSDVTPPTTTATSSPAANAAGWNNTNVSVSLSATDNVGGSGVKEITYSASGAQSIAETTVAGNSVSGISITAEGTTTLSFFATDNAGNVETTKSLVVKIDKTAPVLAASAVKGTAPAFADATAYSENAWTNKDVKVSFSCTDAGGSGVAAGSPSPASETFTSEGEHTANSSCSDVAGNSDSESFGVKIDKTAPAISFVGQSPAKNSDGWNKTDVTLSWSCTDALSGPVSGTVTKEITSEGSGQQATGTCADLAGNEASSTDGDVNLDKTKPVVNVTGVTHGTTYTLGSVPTPGCSTSDALSGVKTAASLSVSGGPVGSITASCDGAEDKAGNTNSASATYTVHYSWNGFFQPIDNNPDQSGNVAFATVWNSAKAGQAIPVKFSLNGNQGLSIFATGFPKSTKVPCPAALPVVDLIETYASSTSGLQYDASADQYIYVWKTTSSLAGTCQRLDVKLVDGTFHYAFFKFTK